MEELRGGIFSHLQTLARSSRADVTQLLNFCPFASPRAVATFRVHSLSPPI